jgi:BirA family biotin operon repressor/biotin-[acetyl-CoA-carboxylase] ligase
VGGTCLDDLRQADEPVDRRRLLDALLVALAPRRRQLDDPAGRRALAGEIGVLCATLGQEVQVTVEGEVVVGTATGLDDRGALVIETREGTRVVDAGDVVHLRRAPGAQVAPG